MARPLRIEYDGALYHVTSRGNAKKSIFEDEIDRAIFLDTLKKVNKRYNWFCHAYCLIDNHYHLIIETPDGNLSKGMRQLNGVYTQIFNKRHDRVGHVFQGRYKAILVQKESHFLEVARYVVLNPVRTWAIESPEQWAWSSYRATAGLEKPHHCLTTDLILRQFGTDRKLAENKYQEFVKEGIGGRSIWAKVKGQSILGESNFADRLTSYVKEYQDIKEIPKNQRYLNRPKLDSLFATEISGEKQIRDGKIIKAVERYGYSQKEIADYLGLHYSTISRLVKEMSKSKT